MRAGAAHISRNGGASPICRLTTRARTEAGVISGWFEMLAALLARSRHPPRASALVASRGQLCGAPAMLGANGSSGATFVVNRTAATLAGLDLVETFKLRSACCTMRGYYVYPTPKKPAPEGDVLAPDGLGGTEVARTLGTTRPSFLRVTDSSPPASIVVIRNAEERSYTRCGLFACRFRIANGIVDLIGNVGGAI
jgi:hypothetical protein